jgi:hypothetical protein
MEEIWILCITVGNGNVPRACFSTAPPLEKLDGALVLLRLLERRECSQISASASFRIDFSRIQAILAGFKLIAAKGPLWHKKDGGAQRIPKRLHGVDQESTWGYSEHDDWV